MAVIVLLLFFFVSVLLLSYLFLAGGAERRRPPLPPGPKGWPLLGNLLQLGSKPHQTLQILSKSHGSAGLLHIRLGTVDVVVISSASAAEKCFRSHDASLSSRPPNSVGKHITYNSQDLIMAPYGSRWRMLRKLCSMHLFSNKALDSFLHVREEEVVRLVRELASGREAAVDVGRVAYTCVTNTMARVLVGQRVILEEVTEFKEIAMEMMRLAGEHNIGDFVSGIDWLDLQDMFIAGVDTTSITFEWILAELIRHPHILARAQHELDSVVGRDRLISESDLSKLSFLQAIVKEILRLHPAVPLSVPRMTIEDFEIDGFHIPKGVTLFINIWAIGRDPVTWPDDPCEFNPDRFGSGSSHENVDVKANDFELIPFGAGRRICAGMNLGLRIIHLMTATLLHAFDWILPDGEKVDMLDMEESFGSTMRKTRPLIAKTMPRLTHEAYL